MNPDPPALVVDQLSKRFGQTVALRDVSLTIPQGKVTALLGRNGSGKSTLVRLLLGLEQPTSGSSQILGVDSTRLDPATRGRIGYLAEGHPTYGWMTVDAAERFTRRFHRTWDHALFQRVIDHFRIARRQRARSLSRGQRGGLTLALVLATDPELLVFDDPALGLDPLARRALLEAMLFASHESGRTIVFSSHDLTDVERLAERVVVIDRGVVRADCNAQTIQRRLVRVAVDGGPTNIDTDALPGFVQSHVGPDGWRGVMIADENGELEAEQRIALQRHGGEVSVLPLAMTQAVEALMDEPGPRRSFFEQMTAEPEPAL